MDVYIPYEIFKSGLMKKKYDLVNDTLKVALLTKAYVPNAGSDSYWGEISPNEASGTGYVGGGQALANKSVNDDAITQEGFFDADDLIWSNLTVTFRYIVIYKDTGDPKTSPLIGYIDLATDRSIVESNYMIQWASNGILRIL